jgi:non-heme chloroperoxidase
MAIVILKDSTEIFYKDWGKGRPIVFHQGVVGDYAITFREKKQHLVVPVISVAATLDPRDAIHIGHWTGGGEVARNRSGRVAKAALISAVPPVRSDTNTLLSSKRSGFEPRV